MNHSNRKLAALAAALVAVSVQHASTAQKRVTPVKFESCATQESKDAPGKLFDGKITVADKWCCFHAGYNTEQTHWVAVDLGQAYILSKTVLYHESFIDPASSHLVTEDFVVRYSDASISGPWKDLVTIKDNTQPFTEIPANGVKARFLRLEVTDPQSVNSPNRQNQDWALRLLEWEFVVSDSAAPPAGAAGAQAGAPGPPAQVTPQPTAARRTLYYFYRGDHERSRTFYNSVVLKRENWPAVTRYQIVPVEMSSNGQKAAEMGVFKSPTFVIATPDGKKKAELSGLQEESDFLKFLDANAGP